MSKNYNIEDPKMERTVLRGLVSYGYSQIRKMYYASNINSRLRDEEKQDEISEIYNLINGSFLSKDFEASRFCANAKGWQDFLSANDLFHFFSFQSIIIKSLSSEEKSIKPDMVGKISNTKNISKWKPEKIIFDEKVALPSKGTAKREFIDSEEARKEVLTNMIFKNLKENIYDEEKANQTKQFIIDSGCFNKFSGLVAQSFFNSMQENIKNLKEEQVLGDYNISKVVGKTFDGEDLYENINGKNIGTLSAGKYYGTVFDFDEDGEELVPKFTTKEYFNNNENIEDNDKIEQ